MLFNLKKGNPATCDYTARLGRHYANVSSFGPVARTLCSQCRGLGSIPSQRIGSHMPKLRVQMLQLRPGAVKGINR